MVRKRASSSTSTLLAAAAAAVLAVNGCGGGAREMTLPALPSESSAPVLVDAASAPADVEALPEATVAESDDARADLRPASSSESKPVKLLDRHPVHLMQDFESVYDLEAPPEENQGFNEGGVNLDVRVSYVTDHIFRGIDRTEGNGGFNDEEGNPVNFEPDEPDFEPGGEDAANLQVNTKLKFDLGRIPSPIVGLFANVYNDDPINQFQEIRPFVGLEWMIKPFIIAAGQTTYVYPERDDVNTAEVWASVTLDDSFLFRSQRPVLSPYIFAAYDYDLYEGTYLEAGIKHEMAIEDTPITLQFIADLAGVINNPQFTRANEEDTGLQHWEIGVIARYNLNTLFNISRRYGTFHVEGYLFYTDGLDDDLIADTELWGGVGIGFRY